MLASSLMVFTSPASLAIAIAMVTVIIAAAFFRRIAGDRRGLILIGVGAVLLAIAAGQPAWNWTGQPAIVVMVDLSPSTRGATFRDRAALESRVHQLLGSQPFEMIAFADNSRPMPTETMLQDIPADRTLFSPPTADAIVLLSDGQFELPAFSPPTYVLIDPVLDHPNDAAVNDLKTADAQVLATVTVASGQRNLKWTGATPSKPNQGATHFSELATPTGTGEITARLSPGDLWPENDSLSIIPPTPVEKQKWWISDPPAPSGWTAFSPTAFPLGADSLLQASVIVLDDIQADEMSFDQQSRLSSYVRDFAGALVIVGGPHAFAAGGYGNSILDPLSPLASSPPEPTAQWVLLIDGSGSMAGEPWKTEVDAVTRLLPQLPAADNVAIGSFAETLNWWSSGKFAARTAKLQLPPPNVGPNGPTNLAATLKNIAENSDGSTVTHLLLMTDADAELPQSDQLSSLMAAKKIHLHLLAIGSGGALDVLRSIAEKTGGSAISQLDPALWVRSAAQLLRSAMPDHYQHRAIALTPAPPASIGEWNQTWLKPDATAIQTSAEAPIVANWRHGLGQVTSIAYPADISEIEKYARKIQQPPADPRFTVEWEQGATLQVTVHAIDRDHYLNGLPMTLETQDPQVEGSVTPTPIPQIGPGEYHLKLPAARTPHIIRVRNGQHILRQFAVAGRYAEEFNAVGNNMENLCALADRTGGKVIYPGKVELLHFAGKIEQVDLTAAFACAAFASLALGMICWRRSS